MIITRTPFRISFVGGGSDMAAFYLQNKGAVLSTSIDKYMYISSHRFFDNEKIRAKYSKTELVDSPNELEHPLLKQALLKTNIHKGLEISSIADLPAGSGMGSSSAFTVGVLHNLYSVNGKEVSKELLAKEACEIEIDILKEPIGKQDQYASAYGGLNVIEFNKDNSVTVEPLHLEKETLTTLQNNLIMFYYGNPRKASDILTEQKRNTTKSNKINILNNMVSLVYELRDALKNEKLNLFGEILHENWNLKQQLASGISNNEISEIYNHALSHGATGGKLLGAGGGGFLLFYCNKEKQNKLIESLPKLRHFPFSFEENGSTQLNFANN